MAFQRSYSKVWWGSISDNLTYQNVGGFHSLEGNFKWSGNLSKIQETDESSKSWSSHDSPGSLRSQDSGFSDNDEAPHLRLLSPNKSEANDSSPFSSKSIETPPTVIRRNMQSSPSSVARRISLSAPTSPVSSNKEYDLISQMNKISLVNIKSDSKDLHKDESHCNCSVGKDKSVKRRRVTNQRVRRSLLENNLNLINESNKLNVYEDFQNQTVFLGVKEDGNNNISGKSIIEVSYSPIKGIYKTQFTASTSTPKNNHINDIHSKDNFKEIIEREGHISYHSLKENVHADILPPPVENWLNELRLSYNHEVMSTLQTKSIAQEAFRNLKITTTTVAKIIRQLQTRSLILQGEFERAEKVLRGEKEASIREAVVISVELIDSVYDFSKVLEKRSVFFTECRNDRKKFEDNIDHIKLITRDLRISLEKQHYLDTESLHDDIQVLKRYVLITLRLVFEKLIRVIVLNIENSKCDLMLRANLNMVATLSNIDYTGFASLNDAFLKNESIRIFLLIVLDSKYSSIRALALRALATICSSSESIRQLGDAEGVEIIKDILSCDSNNKKRTEPEKREAVSLLTQITAPWHGSNHKVNGLKDSVEGIVEGLTDIIEKTNCCQTLLLCAASLNNLTRLEVTSIYSIMSNESVVKLKEAIESRGPGVSIFLYEQIISMLHNMSGNKKSHSHLANRNIINFITFIFESQFYEKFNSRAENDAQRRTIKMILHIFTRLIHECVIGHEILEYNFIPIFSKVEKNLNGNSEYMRDISILNRQINDSLSHSYKNFNRSSEERLSNNSGAKFNLTRQESYV